MPVVASALFLAALAVIASERIHRTKAALVGASIVVVFGLLDVDGAIAAVDWETLGLLATRPRVAADSGLARLLEVVRRLLANGSPHARARRDGRGGEGAPGGAPADRRARRDAAGG